MDRIPNAISILKSNKAINSIVERVLVCGLLLLYSIWFKLQKNDIFSFLWL